MEKKILKKLTVKLNFLSHHIPQIFFLRTLNAQETQDFLLQFSDKKVRAISEQYLKVVSGLFLRQEIQKTPRYYVLGMHWKNLSEKEFRRILQVGLFEYRDLRRKPVI